MSVRVFRQLTCDHPGCWTASYPTPAQEWKDFLRWLLEERGWRQVQQERGALHYCRVHAQEAR